MLHYNIPLRILRNTKYLSLVNALALARTKKPSQSSGTYSPDDVHRLARKLEDLRGKLDTEQQRELLDHLIDGAEMFFKEEPKVEEVIVVEKQIKKAVISALRPFINSKRGNRQDLYFWIRRPTDIAPR
jgi:hypothetical protein